MMGTAVVLGDGTISKRGIAAAPRACTTCEAMEHEENEQKIDAHRKRKQWVKKHTKGGSHGN
jgi:hypothetical protein